MNTSCIREAVERGEIVLEHVKSHDNVADMLTKPFSETLHTKKSYQRSPTTTTTGQHILNPTNPSQHHMSAFVIPTITPTKIITPIYSTTYQSGLRTL